ncbi:hypothetical protein ALO93_200058 [Pseudomonas amygdali pv. sesami]|nr:hypothetical protein ALO93_200058 [Pseudomonas amygdali pv. sesami]
MLLSYVAYPSRVESLHAMPHQSAPKKKDDLSAETHSERT